MPVVLSLPVMIKIKLSLDIAKCPLGGKIASGLELHMLYTVRVEGKRVDIMGWEFVGRGSGLGKNIGKEIFFP